MWVAWIGWRPKPHGVRGWHPPAMIAFLVVVPQLAMLQLDPDLRSLSSIAAVSGLVIFPTIGLAGILLYVQWRITGSRGTATLATVLGIVSVNGLTFEMLKVTEPAWVADRPAWMLILDLLLAAALLTLLDSAERVTLPTDPMVAALVLGLCVTEIDLLVGRHAPPLHPTELSLAVGEVALMVISFAIAHATLRLTSIPRWATVRIALSLVLLSISWAMTGHALAAADLRLVVSLAAGIVGTILLCDTAFALVRHAIRKERQAVRALHRQLAALEVEGRADQAKLHEIKGSIAGIASACRLIRYAEDLPTPGRDRLEEMLELESSRLERLVHEAGGRERDDDPEAKVDLDSTIGAVVTAHRAQGHRVKWQPSGVQVRGRRDDIAEVINILLDNAAKHAPTASADIDVVRQHETIEIAVSDDGPGVSPSVGAKLFDWGARGPQSSGQGIGLHVAHNLMHQRGTYLRLEDRPGCGARFVVGLPAAGDGR